MATMIPQSIPFDAPASEQRVFELLRDAPETEGWWVIWSYRPIQYDLQSGRRREVDFLALIPRMGILCLEVKGGGFEIRDGEWYRPGDRETVEPPDRQSERAMHALRNELEREFRGNNDVLATPVDFAVAFTDWVWPAGIRQPTPLIYDKNVFDVPGMLVKRMAEDGRRLKNPVKPSRSQAKRPNDATIRRLADHLAPSFRLSAGPQLDVIHEQLIRLTQEQYMVLDMFGENDRCLVKGMAGTGKTMLALEYARRSARSGRRTGLLCFNLLLGNFLKGQTQAHPEITAGGFWPDLMRPLILGGAHAEQFRRDENSAANERELYNVIYPRYAKLALTDSGPLFDALVVDEAPDLCRPPYLDLMDLMLTGGLSGGRWAMFGDFSHQAIFSGGEGGADDALLRYAGQPARVSLRVNCRNALPIARDTARIADSDMPETRRIEGPRPEYRYWTDAAELSALLDEQVRQLLNQGVRIEEIVVLSEHRLEDSALDINRHYGGRRLVTYTRGQRSESSDGTPGLKFCSIPSFKGMESEAIILLLGRLDADASGASRPFDPQNARAYAYIGMSRARGALVALVHAGLRGELESRLAA